MWSVGCVMVSMQFGTHRACMAHVLLVVITHVYREGLKMLQPCHLGYVTVEPLYSGLIGTSEFVLIMEVKYTARY